MGRHEIAFDTHRELETVELVKAQLAAIFGQDEPDEESWLATIESETNILEIIDRLTLEEGDVAGHIKRIDDTMAIYAQRRARMVKRQEMLKALLCVVFERIEAKTLPRPFGTLTRRQNPASISITNDIDVPRGYWTTPVYVAPEPKIDSKLLKNDVVARDKEREEAIAELRAPYAQIIEEAQADRNEETRTTRIDAIEALIADGMRAINERLPLIPGVQLDAPSFSMSIRRK